MGLKHVKHSFIPTQFYFSLMIIIEIKEIIILNNLPINFQITKPGK